MPMTDIPLPHERTIPHEHLNTAGHELNHALVAYSLGVSVKLISTHPAGNSLGRTEFFGGMSPETFKTIAAAGAVDTPHSAASGYGMDMYMIDMLHHYHGGKGRSGALSEASGIINSYSHEVRARAAEIVAYLGEVSGSQIGTILRQAYTELFLEGKERNKDSYMKIRTMVDVIDDANKKETNNKDIITIVSYPDGEHAVEYKKNGTKIIEVVYCSICKGQGVHVSGCPAIKSTTI